MVRPTYYQYFYFRVVAHAYFSYLLSCSALYHFLSPHNAEHGRVVSQMQYLSWPDHGTPDDPGEFVEFVDEVREMRDKAPPLAPTIVHCSAGIGEHCHPILCSFFWRLRICYCHFEI